VEKNPRLSRDFLTGVQLDNGLAITLSNQSNNNKVRHRETPKWLNLSN